MFVNNNRCTKLIMIILMIVILSMVVSCKKQDSYKKQEVYKGDINIVTDKNHELQFKYAAEEFKKVQNKVNINITVSNNTQSNLKRFLKSEDYKKDIISVDNENLQYSVDKYKDDILNLTNSVSGYKNSIISNRIGDNSIDGKIYSMPWDATPKLIVYRKDLFDSKGIDANSIKTWKDYIEVGEKLSEDTGKIFMGNYENNNLNLFFANQLGTGYFNDKKLDFESEKWSRIFELEKDIYMANIISNFSSEREMMESAEAGKTLTFIASPYSVYKLMKDIPKVKGVWGIMQLPAFESGGNTSVSTDGTNIIVNKNSKNFQLALAFIKFALTDDKLQLDLLDNTGRFPVYKTAYSFKYMDKPVDYFNSNVWKMFAISQQNAYNVEYTKNFPKVKDKINNVLSSDNLKNKDTKTLIDIIGKSLEKNLK
ncbi:ABC transporter substrate-binding protein [Clostridium tyrobutyricum]|uniref:ABC transporter substrate-binding protein n=1 Tax=Clostridium tyrobutyricum TaxID=1519 RepID=UPI001C390108|nr:ABC transporter substrate-binding protein [Clostridium tyrobutyricum]MBV4418793.1 ABC transporter substrate-binding protein [Clostridium tyrobutyricum]